MTIDQLLCELQQRRQFNKCLHLAQTVNSKETNSNQLLVEELSFRNKTSHSLKQKT